MNYINIYSPGVYKITQKNIYIINSKKINNGYFYLGICSYNGSIVYLGYKENNTIKWYTPLPSSFKGYSQIGARKHFKDKIYVKGKGAIIIADASSGNRLFSAGIHAFAGRYAVRTKDLVKIEVSTDKSVLNQVKVYLLIDNETLVQEVSPEKFKRGYWSSGWFHPNYFVEHIVIVFDISQDTYVFINISIKIKTSEINIISLLYNNIFLIILAILAIITITLKVRGR